MDSLIYHNDRIIPLAEARLSPGQMGLLMGWGVFTTLRIYQGVPFAFDRHWHRMAHDAERLGIALDYHQEDVRDAIIKLAAANHRPECAARLSFIKNQGGMWADAANSPPTDLLIFTRELTAWPAAHRVSCAVRNNAPLKLRGSAWALMRNTFMAQSFLLTALALRMRQTVRAIMSSSSVRMTRTLTRPESGEIRGAF